MRPIHGVVDSPSLDLLLGLLDRLEPVQIESFLPEFPFEAFYVCILHTVRPHSSQNDITQAKFVGRFEEQKSDQNPLVQ